MEIKKIMFATDFSEGSAHALPYAVDMAKRYSARLYLVHVVYDVAKTAGWYVPHVNMDAMYKDIEAGARAELDKCFTEEMHRVQEIEKVVLKGVPYEELARFAGEHTIDMIVLGTHGRKGLDRMLFGSTAEQVVRYAPCPVLSVRIPNYQQ